jgi:hypothetical protein
MQGMTDSFKNTILTSTDRKYTLSVFIGETKINTNDIKAYEISTTQPQDKFTIGNTISKTLKLTLSTIENDYILYNEPIKLKLLVKFSNSAQQADVALGTFYIDKVSKTDNEIAITAYDAFYKLQGLYNCELPNNKTTATILKDITAKTGIKFVGTGKIYTIADDIKGYTYRETIGIIAGLNGANAHVNRDNVIYFSSLNNNDCNLSLTDYNLFDGNSFDESPYTVKEVNLYKDKDTKWENSTGGKCSNTFIYQLRKPLYDPANSDRYF